jgi:uncharacterized protein YndB with AHSA1/START domain
MSSIPATHGSFTIEREFDAKPERVFKAFGDADARKRWFVGPPGWVQTERSSDFKVGGVEIVAGDWPDGRNSRFTCRYEDIIPGERIVYSYHMHISGLHISISLATVEFVASGTGTKLTFTEHATFLNGYDDPGAANRKVGSEFMLQNIANFLAG